MIKMYSLIWVGWVLLELFIKNHQILSFSGRDWSFFNLCMHKRAVPNKCFGEHGNPDSRIWHLEQSKAPILKRLTVWISYYGTINTTNAFNNKYYSINSTLQQCASPEQKVNSLNSTTAKRIFWAHPIPLPRIPTSYF